MNSSISAPLIYYDFTDKEPRPQMLAYGRVVWGVLESVEEAENNLLLVRIAGIDRYVDSSVAEKLQGKIGKKISILHFDNSNGKEQWSAGVVHNPEVET
ncbi:Uncharacterised protein [uncultured archaeon]|nr:Uncharacterised protein [uncultured archaeon]